MRLVSKVAGLWLAMFAVTAVVPHAPMLLPSNFWEILSPLHAEEGGALSRGDIPQIQKSQSSMLQREFAGLATSHRGETEIYTLAIAGWADNVFIKELDGGSAAIASVKKQIGCAKCRERNNDVSQMRNAHSRSPPRR